MKTKLLLVTAFVLFAMGTSFAQSKKTMDMLKEKYGKDVIAYQRGKGSNSCYLIKMGYSGMAGICDKKGQIIVPMKYDDVFLWGKGSKKEPFWYKVKLNYKEGVCDATGTEIIPPIYGNVFYNSDQGVFRASGLGGIKGSLEIGLNPDGTAKGTYKPLPGHDEKGLALYKQMEEKYGFAYRGGEGTSENPFYFIVTQNKKEGICDETGREVIPPKYDNVTRVGGWMWGNIRIPLWYVIKQNGKVGACNINGVEIIPPIYDNIKNKGFYYTEFNGKEIRINLNNPEAAAKNIYKDRLEAANKEKAIAKPATSPTSSKTSQATAKSGNASAETTKKTGLLYSGTYTISGEVYYREDKEYYEDLYSKDEYVEIKIYEDSIIIKDNKGNTEIAERIEWRRIEDLFKKIIGYDFARGKKLYWAESDCIIHFIFIYSVDSEYNIHKIKIVQSSQKKEITSTVDIPMAKGKKEMPRHY